MEQVRKVFLMIHFPDDMQLSPEFALKYAYFLSVSYI